MKCLRWILFISFSLLVRESVGKAIPEDAVTDPTLYSDKDEVEFLNHKNYMSLFGKERAAFVEFYSHWCGACQRYSKHWKELADMTKQWHSKVMRVAAINCADPKNQNVCQDFGINYYPALKLIPANAKWENKDHDALLIKTENSTVLIKQMIDFIDNHENKPSGWPLLNAYTPKTVDGLFLNNGDARHAILIAEKDNSYLGRKLMLEFFSFNDRLIIQRITQDSELYKQFNGDKNEFPSAYIIKNDRNKTSVHFNQAYVDQFSKLNPSATELVKSLEEVQAAENEDKNAADSDKKLIDLIHRFIGHLTSEKNSFKVDTVPKINTELVRLEIKNQQEHLKSQNRIFMQDLESGLSLMLRSDIASNQLITGPKMDALKEILRILVKFFPGRKPVRSYLVELHNKISHIKEITGDQWKDLANHEEPTSYLPTKIGWQHCKGSSPIYRGYPCGLWTIFHALTVSQVEQERAKPKPFTQDFDVQEVVNAIRLFVLNFFTCKECVQNFRIETEDWQSHLSYTYDAVRYMWKVHNSVNERLKLETNNDPSYPKVLFPSKVQCPKCYKTDLEVKVGESPFVRSELLVFLQSFYSKFEIVGGESMAVDVNKLPSDLKNLDNNRELLDTLDIKSESFQSFEEHKNDNLINFTIFLLLVTVLGLFLMFYGYNMKRERIKAHII